MRNEPMSNAPFAVPPDSPFFPTSDSGEACFKFENGLWSLCTFNSWPPEAQARCAAVAAMELDRTTARVDIMKIGGWPEYYRARAGAEYARNAYAAARERMRGEAT